MMKTAPRAFALAAACGLALSACSYDPVEDTETQVAVNDGDTLASALSGNEDLSTLADALSEADLNSLFDGPGSYTVLAPTDSAFEALGERGGALLSEEQRPLLVGLLRDHIVVGHITPDAIRSAIESGGGSARMATMGDGDVTFGMNGDVLTVTAPNGQTARIAAQVVEAGNGVALPIDSVLLPEGADQ